MPFEDTVVPTLRGPIVDPETGRWHSRHVINQDFVASVGQGTIAERDLLTKGASLDGFKNHPFFGHHMHEFLFQAGQPREIWQAFGAAMGIEPGEQGVGTPVSAARFGVVAKEDAGAQN